MIHSICPSPLPLLQICICYCFQMLLGIWSHPSNLVPRVLSLLPKRKIPGCCFRAEKRSAQASVHPLSQAQGGNFLCVDCACLLLEFWVKYTRCEPFLPVKHFYLTCLPFFSSLEHYSEFRTTNVKEKTGHSVNLRWNKRFWTFLKSECCFWLCIRFIYELISPGWIKTHLYSVICSYGYFFYMPRFITFAATALSLSSVKEPYCRIRVIKLVRLLNFLGNRRPAGSRSQDYFSVAQVIIVRVFFIFHYIVLFSSALWKFLFFIRITFCTQIVLFTRCEVENDNCRQWLQNNWLFSCKQLLQLDLTEATKTNPYVQFSAFSNDRLSLICFNEDPRMDQLSLLKIVKWLIMAWLPSCNWSLVRLSSYRKFISSLSARSFWNNVTLTLFEGNPTYA